MGRKNTMNYEVAFHRNALCKSVGVAQIVALQQKAGGEVLMFQIHNHRIGGA